jgi:hypothetical protein
MLKEIAKVILNEMALIEEAESNCDDRWNTLKGYLEAAQQNERLKTGTSHRKVSYLREYNAAKRKSGYQKE